MIRQLNVLLNNGRQTAVTVFELHNVVYMFHTQWNVSIHNLITAAA